MISIINSWAKGIILAIIIATIIEIILPEGNNKKHIKTIIGIYILFVIIQPLISTNKININAIIQETTSMIDEYETEELTLETNQYIEETYKNKIQEDIKEKIKNKGYKINSLSLNIETKSEELYGQVNSIKIQISKIENMNEEQNITENVVKKIDNVEVDLSNMPTEENSVNEEITENELDELKEYLKTEYGTSIEKIHINE